MDQATWKQQPLEKLILSSLKEQLGKDDASTIFAGYLSARDNLPPIWEQIRGTEKFLTDHGPRHIQNVLDNAYRLLRESKEDEAGDRLTGIEFYLIGLIILFHDVGNVHGREGHADRGRITQIYDQIRKGPNQDLQEKKIVITAASAHTGSARNGSKDTFRDLPMEPISFLGEPVRVRTLAAIVRLADELAEGPQRTSEYLRQTGYYDEESVIHHEYASVTDVRIDRGTERISLHYNIPIPKDLSLSDKWLSLENLLSKIFERLQKLDQERKYARYYCSLLEPFKSVYARFDFWHAGNLLDLDLAPLILDDKIIPGESSKPISEVDPAYEISQLLHEIKQKAAASDQTTHQRGNTSRRANSRDSDRRSHGIIGRLVNCFWQK